MTAYKYTKRQEQAQESRHKMLETAFLLFADQGYAKTSVHAICQHMGVADSLMYHYFPGGKQELMKTILREKMQVLIEELNAENASMEGLPIEEVLNQLYLRITRIFQGHIDIFRLLVREREILDLIDSGDFILMLAQRILWFPRLLEKRAQAGEIGIMDYECAAELMDAYMLRNLMFSLIFGAPDPLADEDYRKRLIMYQVNLWKNGNCSQNKEGKENE